MKQKDHQQNELCQPGNHAAMTTPHENRFSAKKEKKQ